LRRASGLWDEKDNKKGGMMTLILYLEDRYLVILKEKNNYYYIKTAFYIEQDHELRKKIKNYYNFTNKKQNTPSTT